MPVRISHIEGTPNLQILFKALDSFLFGNYGFDKNFYSFIDNNVMNSLSTVADGSKAAVDLVC